MLNRDAAKLILEALVNSTDSQPAHCIPEAYYKAEFN